MRQRERRPGRRRRDQVVVEVDQLLLAQLYPLLGLLEVRDQPYEVVKKGVVSFRLGVTQMSGNNFSWGNFEH